MSAPQLLERVLPKRRRLRTVLGWNMKVGRGRAAIAGVRAFIKEHDPEAFLLQEAMNYTAALKVTFPLWRVYGGIPFTEGSNCVIMVRRSVRRGRRKGHGWGVIRNRVPWWFDHPDREPVKHPGRKWRWARADGVNLLSGHKATNALGFNRAAGREEADSLVEWTKEHDGEVLAHLDWNNLCTDKRPDGPVEIARRVGGMLLVPKGGETRPDYALVRDGEWTARRVGREGSDHQCIRYDRVS